MVINNPTNNMTNFTIHEKINDIFVKYHIDNNLPTNEKIFEVSNLIDETEADLMMIYYNIERIYDDYDFEDKQSAILEYSLGNTDRFADPYY
jgi:hypothetical protein